MMVFPAARVIHQPHYHGREDSVIDGNEASSYCGVVLGNPENHDTREVDHHGGYRQASEELEDPPVVVFAPGRSHTAG